MNALDLSGVCGPCPLSNVTEPGPGVYIIRLRPEPQTDGTVLAAVLTGTVIYVGKAAEPLVRRVARTHAATGKTHYSTLRRSLGAILRERLALVPIPRQDGLARYYGFTREGELALSEWIERNLEAFWLPLPVEQVLPKEQELIGEYQPILNLTHCKTAFSPVIRKLRRECIRLAGARRT